MRKLRRVLVPLLVLAAITGGLASASGSSRTTPRSRSGHAVVHVVKVSHTAKTSAAAPLSTLPLGISASGHDWTTGRGDLAQSDFSTLSQINTGNVSSLKVVWQDSFDAATYSGGVQGNGIEVSGANNNLPEPNGTVFIGSNQGYYAVNAVTGAQLWSYIGPAAVSNRLSAGNTPRAFAYGNGMIYGGQADGSVVGLNSATGKAVWTNQVSAVGTFPGWVNQSEPAVQFCGTVGCDAASGGAGIVFSGPNYGDEAMRGNLDAINAKTGALIWRVFMTPDPTEQPFILTWGNPTQAAAGGGATWTAGAVDPTIGPDGTIYQGTGNGWPYNGNAPGKQLFTDSVVAIDIATGSIRWYYQAVHHDAWDYDMSNPPQLWNTTVNGKPAKVVGIGCKCGYYFMLSRTNGAPIFPIPEKPIPEPVLGGDGAQLNNNWPTQPIPSGGAGAILPHCMSTTDILTYFGETTAPNGTPIIGTCPYAAYTNLAYYTWFASHSGGINYEPNSFDPMTNSVYVCGNVNAYGGEDASNSSGNSVLNLSGNAAGENPSRIISVLSSLNVSTNTINWQQNWIASSPVSATFPAYGPGACETGVLSTAGGLVFVAGQGSANPGSTLLAIDANTGKDVWSYLNPGAGNNSSPVTYMVNGKQYLMMYFKGAQTGHRDLLTVFALNGGK